MPLATALARGAHGRHRAQQVRGGRPGPLGRRCGSFPRVAATATGRGRATEMFGAAAPANGFGRLGRADARAAPRARVRMCAQGYVSLCEHVPVKVVHLWGRARKGA